jgi:hypothetical protein
VTTATPLLLKLVAEVEEDVCWWCRPWFIEPDEAS